MQNEDEIIPLRGMAFNLHGFSTSNPSKAQDAQEADFVTMVGKTIIKHDTRRRLVDTLLGNMFSVSYPAFERDASALANALQNGTVKKAIGNMLKDLGEDSDTDSDIDDDKKDDKQVTKSVLRKVLDDSDYVTDLIGYFYEEASNKENRKCKKIPDSSNHLELIKFAGKIKELRGLWRMLDKLGPILPNRFDGRKDLLAKANPVKDKIQKVVDLDKELNKLVIVDTLARVLNQDTNSIDFMLLNEMNSGMGAFMKEINESTNGQYLVEAGPEMRASGGKGQVEYFPLVYHNGMEYEGMEYVGTKNGIVTISTEEKVAWKKPENKKRSLIEARGKKKKEVESLNKQLWDYRPLVVHKLKKNNKSVWLVGVHTTPYGTEFERVNIFKQLEGSLNKMKQRASDANAVLVVGGDYYVAGEARIRSKDEARKPFLDREGREVTEGDLNENRDLKTKKGDSLNFAEQLSSMGLSDRRPITGTNRNSMGLQVADYWVVSDDLKDKARVGLLHPEKNRVYELESEEQDISNYWMAISDHHPVIIEINHPFTHEYADDEIVDKQVVVLNYLNYLQRQWRSAIIDEMNKGSVTLEGRPPNDDNLESFFEGEDKEWATNNAILEFAGKRTRPLSLDGEDQNIDKKIGAIPGKFKALSDQYREWKGKLGSLSDVADRELADLRNQMRLEKVQSAFSIDDFERYLVTQKAPVKSKRPRSEAANSQEETGNRRPEKKGVKRGSSEDDAGERDGNSSKIRRRNKDENGVEANRSLSENEDQREKRRWGKRRRRK